MPALFMTGATGAVGRRVLAALPERFGQVSCLVRSDGAALGDAHAGVRLVPGDLLKPSSYADALTGVDVVLHMAAATGNAAPYAHLRVNRDGTAALLEAARAAGVQRFIFVSSIAARFADLRHYPYGESKRQAEALVRASDLDWTIVRPTQVVSADSGAFAGLARLVRSGTVVVPGAGGAPVQPIDVVDLAEVLVALLGAVPAERVVELGGPERTTMEDLLLRLHAARFGGRARVVHLPLGALRAAARVAERLLGGRTPVREGQFAAFREDGSAHPSALLAERQPRMKGIDRMLSDAVAGG